MNINMCDLRRLLGADNKRHQNLVLTMTHDIS